MNLVVRQMSRDELGTAMEWAEAEGWGPGRGDADAFFAADPAGFWALEADGEMIASISAVGYPGGVHFMGFYIVRPDHRGEGLGKFLWDGVWAKLDGLVLAGDAVPQQVGNYEKEGFKVAHRNARFIGDPPTAAATQAEIVSAESVAFDVLAKFDEKHTFGARPGFLKEWIAPAERESVVAVDDSGRITGFGVFRPSSGPDRIGPLFAETPEIARDVLVALCGQAGNQVAIDVPLPNRAGVGMVSDLGFEPGFETFRIYRGPAPELPLGRIFGITSLELG